MRVINLLIKYLKNLLHYNIFFIIKMNRMEMEE